MNKIEESKCAQLNSRCFQLRLCEHEKKNSRILKIQIKLNNLNAVNDYYFRFN